jgi:plasmid stabilization system protein ParE
LVKSRRSSKKYRICTDSIAKTAGTTKRSTWSPAAKSRYDRCLKKVDEKQTNEGVKAAERAWQKTLRKRSTMPQHGTGGTRELTGQTASNSVVGGKRMQVSHTVYARIGGLIREFSLPVSVRATARAARNLLQRDDPTAPKKPAAGTRQTAGTTTAPPPAPKAPKPEAEKKKPEEEEEGNDKKKHKSPGVIGRTMLGLNPYTKRHRSVPIYRG